MFTHYFTLRLLGCVYTCTRVDCSLPPRLFSQLRTFDFVCVDYVVPVVCVCFDFATRLIHHYCCAHVLRLFDFYSARFTAFDSLPVGYVVRWFVAVAFAHPIWFYWFCALFALPVALPILQFYVFICTVLVAVARTLFGLIACALFAFLHCVCRLDVCSCFCCSRCFVATSPLFIQLPFSTDCWLPVTHPVVTTLDGYRITFRLFTVHVCAPLRLRCFARCCWFFIFVTFVGSTTLVAFHRWFFTFLLRCAFSQLIRWLIRSLLPAFDFSCVVCVALHLPCLRSRYGLRCSISHTILLPGCVDYVTVLVGSTAVVCAFPTHAVCWFVCVCCVLFLITVLVGYALRLRCVCVYVYARCGTVTFYRFYRCLITRSRLFCYGCGWLRCVAHVCVFTGLRCVLHVYRTVLRLIAFSYPFAFPVTRCSRLFYALPVYVVTGCSLWLHALIVDYHCHSFTIPGFYATHVALRCSCLPFVCVYDYPLCTFVCYVHPVPFTLPAGLPRFWFVYVITHTPFAALPFVCSLRYVCTVALRCIVYARLHAFTIHCARCTRFYVTIPVYAFCVCVLPLCWFVRRFV